MIRASKTTALTTLLGFFLMASPLQAASVVPSEACIDGDPIQVLNFAELPLSDTRARNMAEQAGNWQNRSRYTILTGFLLGTTLFIGGTALGILRIDESNTKPIKNAVGVAGVGLAFGAGGISIGRFGLTRSSQLATDALVLEAEVTNTVNRWRTEEKPCANE